MTAKPLALFLAVALSGLAGAQSWSRSYEAGLTAARGGKWTAAREAFQQAVAGRPDDRSAPTVLPGPATERKLWRDGAPYSPNFLAAYSLYREALTSADPIDSAKTMRTAAGEFETLIAKDQASPESFFFLDVIYTKLGDVTKRTAASDKMTKLGKKVDFKVDTEIVAPEEIAAIQARGASGTTVVTNPNLPIAQPGVGQPTVLPNGVVAPLGDKFAFVVGQSQSRISGGLVPFAATDAQRVHDALVNFAGYPSENVIMLQNASAAEIKSAAAALAKRVGQDATVLIYYAGAGVNLAGKDYLAGVDTESPSDTASMVSKTELFANFVERGARIFSFFEVGRQSDASGFYFGREVATVGSIAQIQATRPNDVIGATYRDNQQVGLFTNAFVQCLSDLRANRLQIFEFTWQVFFAMRRGSSGTTGGGTTQVCTLPQLTNLAADAKF